MEHQIIEGFTRKLAPPSNEMEGYVGALHVKDVQVTNENPLDGSEVDFGQFMVSQWMPDEKEREAIARGEPVFLWIRGKQHPVVTLSAGFATEDSTSENSDAHIPA
jgi:hypothetical protein